MPNGSNMSSVEVDTTAAPKKLDVLDLMPEDWLAELKARAPASLRDVDTLNAKLGAAMARETVYPSDPDKWFRALSFRRPSEVKVVILGQDPYHSPGPDGCGVADGLAFSCRSTSVPQPSLDNILAEAGARTGTGEDGCGTPTKTGTYDLSAWAAQGVLLLNTTLTVARGRPQSHADLPWAVLTQGIVRVVSECAPHAVFLLWGRAAQGLRPHIRHSARHLILETSHPSPFSVDRGFKGCGHFAKANQFLDKHKLGSICWRL